MDDRSCPGDAVIGLASTGVHSNGFSLVRKVLFDQGKLTVESIVPELGGALGETLLTPTRIYAKQILALAEACPIKGIAHITGGGITDNLPRVFPGSLRGAYPSRLVAGAADFPGDPGSRGCRARRNVSGLQYGHRVDSGRGP